ncbi:hypothetical protein Moror_8574 [Moniliophthora roreri MCA 2997]|uniref:Uncharacterized protein n=2 Tax=Moniliophthora roreri TaxID=221103 RepID=V2WLG7_MONRO|nr:hypothetical protein Moror_8574 [Moniliophthora roreri MCA 2997]
MSNQSTSSNSDFIYVFLWLSALREYQAQSSTTQQPRLQAGVYTLLPFVPGGQSVYTISDTNMQQAVQQSTDFQNISAMMNSLNVHFYAMLLARDTGIFINHAQARRTWTQTQTNVRLRLPQMNTFASFESAFYYMIS